MGPRCPCRCRREFSSDRGRRGRSPDAEVLIAECLRAAAKSRTAPPERLLHLLQRETTAGFGVRDEAPQGRLGQRLLRTVLGVLGPLSHGLDATRARC